MLTRRKFLRGGAVLPLVMQAAAEEPPVKTKVQPAEVREPEAGAATHWVLLGTDTGEGIYRAPWDAVRGRLGSRELAAATSHPSFLAQHPTLPVVYCTNENPDTPGSVSSFRLEREGARLTPINRVGTEGSAPCFISVDAKWNALLAANYASGSVACLPVRADGRLGEASEVLGFPADEHGPVTGRQESSHMHCAVVSPDPNFAVCCDLGDDAIRILELSWSKAEAAGGHDVPDIRAVERVRARAGSGPRHVAFHPNQRWMYCIHELDCTIDLYDWAMRDGKPELRLREDSVVKTLRPGVGLTGNTACEILVSPDGRFAYASTRGVDEITTYSIDAKSGLLHEMQRFSCGGKTPRYMAFDPTRHWLVSCNQAAPGSVTVFAHNPATGAIDPTPQTFAAETPMFVLWV